jgi:hypothetical protein
MTAADAIRRAVKEQKPDLALSWVNTMEDVIQEATAGTTTRANLRSPCGLVSGLA